ncbi:MAG: hypothetical protein LBG83_03420 [Oscillospiraceae bacterium]|jgi:hypothetical protein|nr:hypothetical protein [Oscillospiraceae bacterium]
MTPSITIFAGHYGSGKTTVAVRYAIALRKQVAGPLALCDMDIVNPYFRTADSRELLAAHGVELISSPYANTNVELPWIPPEAARICDDPALTSVIDLGGDDCGALALGRFAGRLRGRENLRLWLVMNPYRPLTRDVAGLAEIRREIERAAGLRFNGIVNNTNLGADTTEEIVIGGFAAMRKIASALALPVVLTTAPPGCSTAIPADFGERLEIVPLENRFFGRMP